MKPGTHQFLRAVILFGFALFLLKLLISGDIQKFIAPRMMPYVYFTLIVVGILGAIQYFKTGNEEEHENCGCAHGHHYPKSKIKSFWIYALFIAPVLTGMMFSDHVMGSSAAANKGFKYEMRNTNPEIDTELSTDVEDIAPIELNPGVLTPKKRYPDLYESMTEADVIHLNEDNYIGTISLMEDHMEEYLGKEIVMNGFVFREDSYPENQIVVGRFGISCCVADGGIYGIMVQGVDLNTYKNDTWVEVRGVLNMVDYNGWQLPLIEPKEITEIETPQEPYVYETFEFSG
ncbi:TIGR03943 family protein [Halobacillus sp. Nhm2S1]|uniref:TIGR03943 family putative permease subunit n=1 Tax=Halobacillus sp. Nhm2S1 TaxID=2866716 RepID=UPI001C735EEB|nr:TIGR03943 family protein [Halobacillus sp. Nhm2S1]MBX0359230.1 TIGR03943 family protein [Halobacillus sp. Nhm2S1]